MENGSWEAAKYHSSLCAKRCVKHDGHYWKCEICKTGEMSDGVVINHLKGKKHLRKFLQHGEKVPINHESKFAWCDKNVKCKLPQLGLDRWRWHMSHLCVEFFESTSKSGPGCERLLATLSLYMAKERMALLELAVWKGACLVHFANKTGAASIAHVSMQEIEDYGALDISFEPIQYCQAARMACGSETIITNVLPFLGWYVSTCQ